MRFFELVLSGAALVSAAFAVQFTSYPSGSVKAGEAITLGYTPKDAATTIILRKGPSGNLATLDTLTTSSTGGSFTWTPPTSLEDGDDYAFEIRQEGAEPNYSGQFALTGAGAPVASVSSAAGYSTAASSAVESSSTAYSTAEASSSASSAAYSTAVSTTISTSVVIPTPAGTASASGSIVPSGYNSTISLGSPSATGGSSGPSATNNSPPIENTGAASSLGVNAAALFGAIGAFAYLA